MKFTPSCDNAAASGAIGPSALTAEIGYSHRGVVSRDAVEHFSHCFVERFAHCSLLLALQMEVRGRLSFHARACWEGAQGGLQEGGMHGL